MRHTRKRLLSMLVTLAMVIGLFAAASVTAHAEHADAVIDLYELLNDATTPVTKTNWVYDGEDTITVKDNVTIINGDGDVPDLEDTLYIEDDSYGPYEITWEADYMGSASTLIDASGLELHLDENCLIGTTSGTAIKAGALVVDGMAIVSGGGPGPTIQAESIEAEGLLIVIGGATFTEDDSFIKAYDSGDVYIEGDVSFDGAKSYMEANDGIVSISGDVTFKGDESYVEALKGGIVTIGDVSFMGEKSYIEAHQVITDPGDDEDYRSQVYIDGDVSFDGDESYVEAYDDGIVTIDGDVTFDGDKSYVEAYDDGIVTIDGDVTFDGDKSYVKAERYGAVIVAGTISAKLLASGDAAIKVSDAGGVAVGGIVTSGIGANVSGAESLLFVEGDVEADTGDFGVIASDGGIIVINGTLTADDNEANYIMFYDTDGTTTEIVAESDGVAVTESLLGNYYAYSYEDSLEESVSHVLIGRIVTITFDPNGGAMPAGSPTFADAGVDGTLASLPAAPSRSGFTFSGWFTAATGGARVVAGVTTFPEDATIYAQWSPISSGGGTTPVIPPIIEWNNPFTDVKSTDWFHNDVAYVYQNGLMRGTAATLFSPEVKLTRGMMVTLLYQLAGSPSVSGLANPFKDVGSGQYYTDAVIWAADTGLVGGYGNGNFGPTDNISRQDMVCVMLRYAALAEFTIPIKRNYTGFPDESDIAGYAIDAVLSFYKAGMINGYPDGSFRPTGSTSRAEFAVLIHVFLETVGIVP